MAILFVSYVYDISSAFCERFPCEALGSGDRVGFVGGRNHCLGLNTPADGDSFSFDRAKSGVTILHAALC
jgi:hypothetical protein